VLPVVSIVGRPNVGKSSLFNRVLRRRVAVVDDTPGVTRDRNYMETEWNGLIFYLVDTGGLVPKAKESIPAEINKQVDIAIEESNAVIFIVDGQTGPADLDLLIARHLRKHSAEKVILVANKTESKFAIYDLGALMKLGLGEPIAVSALHGKGVADMLDAVTLIIKKSISEKKVPLDRSVDLSIAILGRPNAGKSSLVNKLLKDDRMIVDDVPGTTRDAIDSYLTLNGKSIRIIDTAGLRKKAQVHNEIEYYCNLRALDSLMRCNVCVLLIDTPQKLGEQDMKILKHAIKQRKGCIVCWNKWDIMEKESKTFDHLVAETREKYMEMQNMPMLAISALTGQRVNTIIDLAFTIKEKMAVRVKTSELKEAFFSWVRVHPHPFNPPKENRFLGIKQLPAPYPHFLVFCTDPENILPVYKRFIINKMHETYDFSGCPLIVDFRPIDKPIRRHFHQEDPAAEEKEL
jgi:GTP-binding protein